RLQAETIEQDLTQLQRRVDVELLAGVLPDLSRQLLALGGQRVVQVLQLGGVHRDARVLHLRQHAYERHFDVVVQRAHPLRIERGSDRLDELRNRERAPRRLDRTVLGLAVEVELQLTRLCGAAAHRELEAGVAQQQIRQEVARFSRVEQIRG